MARKKLYTLIFLQNNDKVLLGYKTRGYGVNYWNGFGGKVEDGENLLECAKRELKEESNLESDLKHYGVLYHNLNDDVSEIIHVYTGTNYWGDIKVSEEMNPITWYPYDGIPYDNMWPQSNKWYPFMLTNKYFSVHFENINENYKCDVKTYDDYKEFVKFLETNRLQ